MPYSLGHFSLVDYTKDMILGIDEVGRGPWAGPLVIGAVILGGTEIEGLTDSKKLSKKQREALYSIIQEKAIAYATGWVDARELDELGMSQSLRLATRRAVEQINDYYTEIIIDGTVNFLDDTGKGKYVKTIKKADLLIPSVSAASIIAKVERDRFMAQQDLVYPGYNFASHSGYGVAKHRLAIEELGVTPLHRLSFSPLRKYQSQVVEKKQFPNHTRVATKYVGDQAESIVADMLKSRGHKILNRNWRTRWCEIDIISQKNDVVYFTEVKYRKNADYGDGLEAITANKLKQMKFAAEYYALKNKLSGQIQLAVSSVSGNNFLIERWIELE